MYLCTRPCYLFSFLHTDLKFSYKDTKKQDRRLKIIKKRCNKKKLILEKNEIFVVY